MDAQELRNLQEAYMEVVENQQLDEALTGERYKKVIKKPGATGAYSRMVLQVIGEVEIKQQEEQELIRRKKWIFTTSSSHTYLMRDMLKHQRQQKPLW